MQAFIKDRRSFQTKAVTAAVYYELKRSVYNTVSEIKTGTLKANIETGDIIILDGLPFIGIISGVEITGQSADLRVEQIDSILSRPLFYTPRTYVYLEDNLKTLTDENYTNCKDVYYALPYLKTEALTHTQAIATPTLNEDGSYSLKSYASQLRRLHNIFLEWNATREELILNITARAVVKKNIDFNNPSYELTEESFSSKSIGKLTAFCEETSAYTDYVLLSDGGVSTNIGALNRVSGEWGVLTVSQKRDELNAVKSKFKEKEYSHKISFRAHKKHGFRLYDRLLIRLNSKLFNSYVSGVTEKMNSETAEISCGELQTRYPYLTMD